MVASKVNHAHRNKSYLLVMFNKFYTIFSFPSYSILYLRSLRISRISSTYRYNFAFAANVYYGLEKNMIYAYKKKKICLIKEYFCFRYSNSLRTCQRCDLLWQASSSSISTFCNESKVFIMHDCLLTRNSYRSLEFFRRNDMVAVTIDDPRDNSIRAT